MASDSLDPKGRYLNADVQVEFGESYKNVSVMVGENWIAIDDGRGTDVIPREQVKWVQTQS